MIGVSLDHNINDWKKAITTDYMPWVHASDLKGLNSEIAHTYGVVSIPTNFLIDTQGVIIGQNVKLDDIKRLLPNLN